MVSRGASSVADRVGADEIGDGGTPMRSRQGLHADCLGHYSQCFGAEAVGAHADDPPFRDFKTVDFVQTLDTADVRNPRTSGSPS